MSNQPNKTKRQLIIDKIIELKKLPYSQKIKLEIQKLQQKL